ncbi:MAG: zinc metallopeptidase [Elusimicrobia bacterium]|nr:zinc metallopeptidase [Elusimicrobiota bacterium]
MPFLFWDPTFLLLIPVLIFAIWAQSMVSSTYKKYSKVASKRGLTGAETARRILAEHGVASVSVESIKGKLSDHYDPIEKRLRLSSDIYSGTSIAALGIAAHEAGHAIQHSKGYAPLNIRNAVYPVASFGSNFAFILFFLGFFFMGSKLLMDIGIFLYLGAVLFTVITLPVEFNASKRAIAILASGNYLQTEELGYARKVLNAAAMTYVAATAMAVVQLIRMLVLRGGRD